jgi:hypothetical protein
MYDNVNFISCFFCTRNKGKLEWKNVINKLMYVYINTICVWKVKSVRAISSATSISDDYKRTCKKKRNHSAPIYESQVEAHLSNPTRWLIWTWNCFQTFSSDNILQIYKKNLKENIYHFFYYRQSAKGKQPVKLEEQNKKKLLYFCFIYISK